MRRYATTGTSCRGVSIDLSIYLDDIRMVSPQTKVTNTPGVGKICVFRLFDKFIHLTAKHLCSTSTMLRIDLNELVERYAASSTTLVVYISLVCSTAGSHEGLFSLPEKGLRQSVLLRLMQSVALPYII